MTLRIRATDPDGDYVFGRPGNFLVDTPAAVAQVIKSRLGLQTGEWFLDTQEGTPYRESVLGYGTQLTRDAAIQSRILDTPGVQEIAEYSSTEVNRSLSVTATVNTDFGSAVVTLTQ